MSNILIALVAFWQFTSGEAHTAFILMWGPLISRIFIVGDAIHFDCVKTETIMDKYLTVGLTTAYLISGFISGNQVPWFIKVPSIGLGYIVFFPKHCRVHI